MSLRNPHALLRLFKRTPAPRPVRIDVAETALRVRAQSLLSGPPIGQCPPLSIAQARDVLAWYRPKRATR